MDYVNIKYLGFFLVFENVEIVAFIFYSSLPTYSYDEQRNKGSQKDDAIAR